MTSPLIDSLVCRFVGRACILCAGDSTLVDCNSTVRTFISPAVSSALVTVSLNGFLVCSFAG